MINLKEKLEQEYKNRNNLKELVDASPDPLVIAKNQNNDFTILTCALFAYGNAKQIVKFLKSLPLDKINTSTKPGSIRIELKDLKYRFQNNEDIVQWFLLSQKNLNIKEVFLNEYYKSNDVISSIRKVIDYLHDNLDGYESRGMKFLIGDSTSKSPYKRWNMFLRWMVRDDNLDLGLWKEIDTKDLIMPLDTHTFELGKEFGLIKRKSYDLKSAIELTESLKKFDKNDPVKYDFAIYRLGQEKK